VSTFRDQVAADIASIYADDGPAEPVTVIPIDGAHRVVNSIVTYGGEFMTADPGQADLATFAFDSATIETPKPHDQYITSDGRAWEAQDGAVMRAAQWVVPCIGGTKRVKP
jgi:hypothetical protein